MHMFLSVLFRWLHVFAAAIAIGGVFVMRFVLPVGLNLIDAEQRQSVFLKCRRIFKLTIHPCILFLLVSGVYNTWGNWNAYRTTVPWSHAMWGPHVILGLTVIGISLYVLAGKQPPKSHRGLMTANFVLLMLVVLAAGLTKYVREHPSQFPRSEARSVK